MEGHVLKRETKLKSSRYLRSQNYNIRDYSSYYSSMLGCNVNKQSRSHRSIASFKKKSRSAASVENEVYSLLFVEGEMRNLTEKRLFQSLLLIELRAPQVCDFIQKETPTEVFSRKFCEIKNGFLKEYLRWLLLGVVFI